MNIERTTLEPGLDVLVYAYDFTSGGGTSGPAWTLVTNGLVAFGQREVVLTILRTVAAPRQFPEGVRGYVRALKHFAVQGKVVADGEVSGYRAPGPFQLGSFVGVGFFDAPPIAGVDVPEHALAGIFLTEGELSMAMSCSVRRVFNALGRAARYFPVPYWSDPARSSVYHLEDAARSVLAKFPRAALPSASATLVGDAMHLSLPSSFATTLATRIQRREGCAILPGRAPGVAAALAWRPEQLEPEAIFDQASDPSAIAATFVAFVPNDAAQDEIRFMEDGYVVMLSSRSADDLSAALPSGGTLTLSSRTDGRALVVTTVPVQ